MSSTDLDNIRKYEDRWLDPDIDEIYPTLDNGGLCDEQ